jgi:hypothetical protein
MDRVPLCRPLTPLQYSIAVLLGLSFTHRKIAAELSVSVATVRSRMRAIAARIPGDLPREQRIIAWVRGASLDVLEGKTLRFEVMRDAQAGRSTAKPSEVRPL